MGRDGGGCAACFDRRGPVFYPRLPKVEVHHQAPAPFPPPGLIFLAGHPMDRGHLPPFHYFPKHVQISFLATDSARGDTAGGGEVRGMGKLVTGGEMPPSSNKTGSGGENKTEQTLQPSGLAQPAVSPPRVPGQPQACLASRGLSPESLRLHGPSSGDQPSPGRGCRSSASGCSALCSDAGSSWNPEAS